MPPPELTNNPNNNSSFNTTNSNPVENIIILSRKIIPINTDKEELEN